MSEASIRLIQPLVRSFFMSGLFFVPKLHVYCTMHFRGKNTLYSLFQSPGAQSDKSNISL